MEKVINTPWGSEITWALTGEYTSKLLYIKTGLSTEEKSHPGVPESLLVSKGRIKYHWYADGETTPYTRVMCPGEHVDVLPGQRHRIEAIDCACVIEVSSVIVKGK